jgi:hypothetical protein
MKASARNNPKVKSYRNNPGTVENTSPPKRVQPGLESYDANKFVKSDLKWSAIAAGIVLVVMIASYLILD